MPEPRVVHDPQVLRAIAHPVRNRILGELDACGSLRAADIARELDIPANQASFHLRQLAKYGLIEEDPAAARDRRDRMWRPVDPGGLTINLEQIEATPGGHSAMKVFRRNAADWGHVVVDDVYGDSHDPGVHKSLTDTTVRLSADEARVLTAELRAVVERWVERTRGRTDEERRTYLYFGVVLPFPRLSGVDPEET